MIFYDTKEEIVGARRSANLRSRCGGDILLTTKSLQPNTEIIIKKHIEGGAILYRVLNVHELANVPVEQLMFNLRKMGELGCKPWQCVLLTVSERGIFDFDKYVYKIAMWIDHGGTSMDTMGNPLGLFFSKREKHFVDTLKTKTILVPAVAPRKEMEVITDWMLTASTFPDVGWQGAKVLRKIMNERNLGDDLLTFIWFLTDWDLYQEADGKMKEIRMKARKWLGLPDGLNIDININGVNKKDVGPV